MEPKQQIEIQLGHMCNNRCVFCVSGQETALGRARPLGMDPVIAELTSAHAAGIRKVTLLGGEPTLQPGFLDVVKRAVDLGFDEVVIFTNGVKTARDAFIAEVLALGRPQKGFVWRISIQGATREAHERTTQKDGSFDRILRSMEHLRARGERVTINMCVVRSNYESVTSFPAIVERFGVEQLHLDMVRPRDAGARTDDELRAMIPRYTDMVPALTAMVRGLPKGFDVNVGNLPYCIAPDLADVIHHDGERTLTVAVDGDAKLSRPWDKYLVKRRDKIKPERCEACLFERSCSGIFEDYARFYGAEELVPVTRLVRPPGEDTLGVTRASVRTRLAALAEAQPFGALTWVETAISDKGTRAEITLETPEKERAIVWLAVGEEGKPSGGYRVDPGRDPSPAMIDGLRAVIYAVRAAERGTMAERSLPLRSLSRR